MAKRKVLLTYTGGTIGMQNDPHTGVLTPFDFNNIYEEFPYIRTLNVDIEVMSLPPIDSSNVTPELWVRLAHIIQDNYDNFDGFVVLHGTDTMSYTASALSFMIENLAKPVVFTGSQIPMGVLRTDGRENLITAMEIAAAYDDCGEAIVPEVTIYFQNKLFRANRTTKYSAEELSAFRSDNYPSLADVGVSIAYNRAYISSPCRCDNPLKISTQLDTRVMIVKIFPGLQPSIFEAMLSIHGIRAVVLETYGSGNAPTAEWFLKLVSDAIKRGVIIVNVTQCKGGSVSMEMYETGQSLQKAGVISGHDMTTECAVTKLIHLLGVSEGTSEVKRLLNCPIRGEFKE